MSELVSTSIRLSPEAREFMGIAAAKLGVTKSEVMESALKAYRQLLAMSGVIDEQKPLISTVFQGEK